MAAATNSFGRPARSPQRSTKATSGPTRSTSKRSNLTSYRQPVRDVDLIIRTGGDERTSNFLPWHANGNEAAVYFCAPYWPEFSKVDFLRGIRTYESREQSWQRTKVDRAVTLVRALGSLELDEAKRVAGRLRDQLPQAGVQAVDDELETQRSTEIVGPDDTENTPASSAD